jgi:hypothetical protein
LIVQTTLQVEELEEIPQRQYLQEAPLIVQIQQHFGELEMPFDVEQGEAEAEVTMMGLATTRQEELEVRVVEQFK